MSIQWVNSSHPYSDRATITTATTTVTIAVDYRVSPEQVTSPGSIVESKMREAIFQSSDLPDDFDTTSTVTIGDATYRAKDIRVNDEPMTGGFTSALLTKEGA